MKCFPQDCNPSTSTLDVAKRTLSRHGKTFHFAGLLLSRLHFEGCARLYHFCRQLDDLVDSPKNDIDSFSLIERIYSDLQQGQSAFPFVQDFLELSRDYGFSTEPALDLVKGLTTDLVDVRIADERALIRYGYGAAGTVGLLMCGVLGVSDPRAHAHAIDLGIGMQLTNIARDVREDARNDRFYLPATWVTPEVINRIRQNVQAQTLVARSVRRLLDLADSYYESGVQGIAYLPFRARFPILVAARAYQEIGNRIRREHCPVWKGRFVVDRKGKVRVAADALLEFVSNKGFRREPAMHATGLHAHLQPLPFAKNC